MADQASCASQLADEGAEPWLEVRTSPWGWLAALSGWLEESCSGPREALASSQGFLTIFSVFPAVLPEVMPLGSWSVHVLLYIKASA